jgi:hypothetical protein
MNPLNVAKSVVWRFAHALRESGQALERAGCRLQGIYSYEEPREWTMQHRLRHTRS